MIYIYCIVIASISFALKARSFVISSRYTPRSRAIQQLFSTEDIEPTVSTTEPTISTVFVGNLPFTVGKDYLTNLLSEKSIECDSVRLVCHEYGKKAGQSRGFGYLDFNTRDSADQCIEALKGTVIEERELQLDISTSAEEAKIGR